MIATYFWIVLSLAPIDAEYSSRPAVISWNPHYPRTGVIPGSIEVKGVARPNKDWKLPQGKVKVEVWPEGGGQNLSFEVDAKNGVWGPSTITGLSPGESYNVLVVVPVATRNSRTALVTDPRVATAR